MSETMLPVAAFAELAGLSVRQVQRYLADERLPGAEKVGGRWLIPAASRPLEHGATSGDVVPVSYGIPVATSYDVAVVSPLGALVELDVAAAVLGTTVGGVRRMAADGLLVVGRYGPRGALRVVLQGR